MYNLDDTYDVHNRKLLRNFPETHIEMDDVGKTKIYIDIKNEHRIVLSCFRHGIITGLSTYKHNRVGHGRLPPLRVWFEYLSTKQKKYVMFHFHDFERIGRYDSD